MPPLLPLRTDESLAHFAVYWWVWSPPETPARKSHTLNELSNFPLQLQQIRYSQHSISKSVLHIWETDKTHAYKHTSVSLGNLSSRADLSYFSTPNRILNEQLFAFKNFQLSTATGSVLLVDQCRWQKEQLAICLATWSYYSNKFLWISRAFLLLCC